MDKVKSRRDDIPVSRRRESLHRQKKMKRKIAILTLALLLAMAAKAQIFTMENEVNELRDPVPEPNGWVINPQNYNEGTDSYTPIGNGIALLAALGGAYLMRKREKAPDER